MRRLWFVAPCAFVFAACAGQPQLTAPDSKSTTSLAPQAAATPLPMVVPDFAACLGPSQPSTCFSAQAPRRISATAILAGAPTGLVATVNGTSVTLTWNAPSSGDAVTSYVIEAGRNRAESNLANFMTGSATTMFSASGVPPGAYYVRVRAHNGAGVSAASNEVFLAIVSGSCSTVNPPTGLVGNVIGRVVTLTWNAPTAVGCSAIFYNLRAGRFSGIADFDFGTPDATARFVASDVAVGTYFVQVYAAYPDGRLSGPSNEIAVTVN